MKKQKTFKSAKALMKSLHVGRHRAKATSCEGAWWYENKGSIDVYMQHGSGKVLTCRILRSTIESWLKRAQALDQ